MSIASTFTAGEGSQNLRVGSSSWQERPELKRHSPGHAQLQKGLSCTPVNPVAQKTRDNSGTSTSDLLPRLIAKWQQRPETPALIRRIHTSSSHLAPHQFGDSAKERIRPGSNHPLRLRTGRSRNEGRECQRDQQVAVEVLLNR